MNRTTPSERQATFVQTMTEQMSKLALTLSTWSQAEPRSLQQLEQHTLRLLHELGNSLLAGLSQLAVPSHPEPDLPCQCGHLARYQRCRPASLSTLLGPITISRAYYLCAACHHGFAPLDGQLQLAAGTLSPGLNQLLALLGATQDSFVQAASVLERLTLVQVCPNSVRAATQDLAAVLAAHDQEVVDTAQQTHTPPASAGPCPPRLYVAMDGVLVHLHDTGWSEFKVGCIYSTRARVSHAPGKQPEIRAEQISYVTGQTAAQQFGWQVWCEAARRGVLQAEEVVILADGAHWIWNVAETHFPGATQIVDWYHASQYVWNAAIALYGDKPEERQRWAKQQLDALWEGQVEQVLARLQQHSNRQDAVVPSLSYYTTHRNRMDYPTYRACGMQIGSGTIESACKQVVSTRLKLAGMIWSAEGAEAVAVVRAWLKSERWDEAIGLRPLPRRKARRQLLDSPATAIAA